MKLTTIIIIIKQKNTQHKMTTKKITEISRNFSLRCGAKCFCALKINKSLCVCLSLCVYSDPVRDCCVDDSGEYECHHTMSRWSRTCVFLLEHLLLCTYDSELSVPASETGDTSFCSVSYI